MGDPRIGGRPWRPVQLRPVEKSAPALASTSAKNFSLPLTDFEMREIRDVLIEHLKIGIAMQVASTVTSQHLLAIATVIQKLHRLERSRV